MNGYSEPKVIFSRQNFLASFGIKIAAMILLIFLAGLLLNYFHVISLPLPRQQSRKIIPPQLSENYGFKTGNLTIPCPVQDIFCASQNLFQFESGQAVGYKTDPNSPVFSHVNVKSLDNIAVLDSPQTNKKYFYESIFSQDSCYTIVYTFPADATFGDITSLPFSTSQKILAILGIEFFAVDGQNLNVIIQVRNDPVDTESQCSLIKKHPDFFKTF